MKHLIMIGAGGFVNTLLDSLSTSEVELCGFVDDVKSGEYMGLPIFGAKIEDVPHYKNFVYFISIGRSVPAKRRWFAEIERLGLEAYNIIDKQAFISPTARIGSGNFIGKFAIVNRGAVIGDNNIINQRAMVSPNVRIGSHCNITTNATINGEVIIGDGVYFGSGAVCNGQLEIGDNTVVGSGGVVVCSLEPNVTAVGVPAKIIKRNGVRL